MTKYLSAKLARATKTMRNANEALEKAHKSKSGIEAAQGEFEKASNNLQALLDKNVKAKHGIRGGARRRRATKRLRHRRSRGTRKQI
jgi:hypothetical protein